MAESTSDENKKDAEERLDRLEKITANLIAALIGASAQTGHRVSPLHGRDSGFFGTRSVVPVERFLDDALYNIESDYSINFFRQLPDLSLLKRRESDQDSRVREQSFRIDALAKELHSLVYTIHAGIDPSSVRGIKWIPVRLYTSWKYKKNFEKLEESLKNVLDLYDVEIADELSTIQGSILKNLIARTRKAASSDEVKDSLQKLKHGVEVETLGKSQAEVNKTNAEAIKALIEAMSSSKNAACQVGSILIVKISDGDNNSVFTKTLTTREMMAIENNQEILMDPKSILGRLNAMCDSDSDHENNMNTTIEAISPESNGE